MLTFKKISPRRVEESTLLDPNCCYCDGYDCRPYLPEKHRNVYDQLTENNKNTGKRPRAVTTNGTLLMAAKKSAARQDRVKTVQVVRNQGSFGFVLRSHAPVYIESTTPGGPADLAGIKAGDAVLCVNGLDVSQTGHKELVQLLQDSGSKPILDVLRVCEPHHKLDDEKKVLHDNKKICQEHGMTIDDTDNHDFRDLVNSLFTIKEKHFLKKSLLGYSANRNLSKLISQMKHIIDTPAKLEVWDVIVPRLQSAHQEQIEAYDSITQMFHTGTKKHRQKAEYIQENSTGSFKSQLEYLLTSDEKSKLKRVLKEYTEKRNAENLVNDLSQLLDTPSKETIWFYIIPLLSTSHQKYIQDVLRLPKHIIKHNGKKKIRQEHKPISFVFPAAAPRDGDVMFHFQYGDEYDTARLNDAQEVKQRQVVDNIDWHNALHDREEGEVVGVRQSQDMEQQSLTLNPAFAVVANENPLTSTKVTMLRKKLPETTTHSIDNLRESRHRRMPSIHDYKTVVNVRGVNRRAEIIEFIDDKPCFITNGNRIPVQVSESEHEQSATAQTGHTVRFSDDELCRKCHLRQPFPRTDGSFKSMDSYTSKAMSAVNAIDEAVATELYDSDGEALPESGDKKMLSVYNTPPPPPPAPPPPPPPKPSESKVQMAVKRINWQKIERADENTVWAQIGGDGSLEDLVKYLELENQFSTKKSKFGETLAQGKIEKCILSPRKAYNISILLGHLKMPVADICESLYRMDTSVLTPDLVKQMLAFAPDEKELNEYHIYKGSIDDLSKADQFMYQLTQVPGYLQRLQAILFRANFAEKVAELKLSLKWIRKASQELRQSRKLAKILEVVLAMGNYMNKGNDRISEAAGFKISFLSQLDLTKTADKKTFLHVLAEAVHKKYPDVISYQSELHSVHEAAKVTRAVSSSAVAHEISELRRVLQEISTTVEKLNGQAPIPNDRFQEVMGHFISEASDEIQGLFSLQAGSLNEFHHMIHYFGEDQKSVTNTDIFGVFSQFLNKLEKAHHENMAMKK